MMPAVIRRIAPARILLVILATTVVWLMVFDALDAPKPEETVHVFIAALSVDTETLENALMEALDDEGIRSVLITVIRESDAFFPTAMMTQGLLVSDLLILPMPILSDFSLKEQFRSLPSADPSVQPVLENGLIVGLVVEPDTLSFDVVFETEEPYGLFTNTTSVHEDSLLEIIRTVMLVSP